MNYICNIIEDLLSNYLYMYICKYMYRLKRQKTLSKLVCLSHKKVGCFFVVVFLGGGNVEWPWSGHILSESLEIRTGGNIELGLLL